VIDDNPMNMIKFTNRLKQAGFTPVLASNPEAALQKFNDLGSAG
jgi:hypothetical protein